MNNQMLCGGQSGVTIFSLGQRVNKILYVQKQQFRKKWQLGVLVMDKWIA